MGHILYVCIFTSNRSLPIKINFTVFLLFALYLLTNSKIAEMDLSAKHVSLFWKASQMDIQNIEKKNDIFITFSLTGTHKSSVDILLFF